ncbi:MAG: hypothetical protein IIA23_05120 [Chloroflexi bacterium]|nr:hypothetical protein [Chloroflexota bacterium]
MCPGSPPTGPGSSLRPGASRGAVVVPCPPASIDREDRAQIDRALARWGGPGPVERVQRLGGLTNRNYKIESPLGTFVLRIAGEGNTGVSGGPRGDLYVVVKVRPHSRFERKGDDLTTEVGVPLEDAVLGGEVEVSTLSGKQVALKIPPLTQNGRLFRLSGLGMPRDGKKKDKRRGDLLARVRVVLPEKLSDRERELFEKLREERKKKVGAG